MNFKELYKQFKKSEVPLTDEELFFLIKKLSPVVEGLHEMGERFHFAWRGAYDDLERLHDYKQARKEQ